MSIQINIHIPDEDIGLGTAALAKRLAVFGYKAAVIVAPEPELTLNVPAGKTVVLTPVGNSISIDGDGATEIVSAAAEQPKEPAKRTRKAKDDKPQISTTPENRVEPEPVVDDEETAQQDAADEAEEVEAARDPVKPLTVDDVKGAVGAYVAKFGMPATQEDGPKIFVAALGNPPPGSDIWKMSLLEKVSQDDLEAAVKAWRNAADAEKRYGA